MMAAHIRELRRNRMHVARLGRREEGRKIIKMTVPDNLTMRGHSFYIELGAIEAERSGRCARLRRERRTWRGALFETLQLVVRVLSLYFCSTTNINRYECREMFRRDIRSYEYNAGEKKWLPSNRQAKRALPGNDGSGSPDMFVENDEYDQQEGDPAPKSTRYC
ncbi:hypothetical protein Y032_0131g1636 [Ancylostoma ceylanicum]|uniref:Uncharacterized protein n=1 Tax=Ancylostoma ceylanicum TaxID=53326 RepID=A0A016T766_9BILA|nr:hypothetical protein Y032_0131g1636 [Ancylostoma ceylanicum]